MADPDPPQDDTFIVKVFFCIIIFADSVFFGILPSKWKRIRNSQTIISLLNAFSAGVFIAIAFNHILPEAAEKYNELCPANERCFPWPFFITFLGYSMILLLDKVAFETHSLFDGDHGHGVDPAEERLHEISR
jgi:zinc transporter 1/2/3